MVRRSGAIAVLALSLCAAHCPHVSADLGGVPAVDTVVGGEARRHPVPDTTSGAGAPGGTNKRYETHMPVLLSALHAPDSAQRMMLVDLSALRHHQEPIMGFQGDDYYGSSSASSSAATSGADYGDTWEDNSLGADDRFARHHWPQEEMHNDIGDNNLLLMPFLPENTLGLHYTGFPFIEDALRLQRQSSHEDAFSDYLRALVSSHDRKRSVFLSQSWQPGGGQSPPQARRHRQPEARTQQQQGAKAPSSDTSNNRERTAKIASPTVRLNRHQPAMPFLFSSKGWHPGGRKRNFFLSRGWGPGGRPLMLRAEYFKKKPSTAGGEEDSSDSEAAAERHAQGYNLASSSSPTVTVTDVRQQRRPCRGSCWHIPHLFGPYW